MVHISSSVIKCQLSLSISIHFTGYHCSIFIKVTMKMHYKYHVCFILLSSYGVNEAVEC